jgi:hypothetical protein
MMTLPLEFIDSGLGRTEPTHHPYAPSLRIQSLWALRERYSIATEDDECDPLFPETIWTTSRILNQYSLLVTVSKSFHATDPRDKIYAFLGFKFTPGLVPDYDLSPEILYIRCASRYISTSLEYSRTQLVNKENRRDHNMRIMSLLYSAGSTNQSHLQLPSWVPDLSVELFTKPLWVTSLNCNCEDDKHRIYIAGGKDELAQVELLGTLRLRIPAKVFDTVIKAGVVEFTLPETTKSLNISTFSKTLHSWMLECNQIGHHGNGIYSAYPTGEPMKEAVRRTVIANRNKDGCDATSAEVEEMHGRLDYLFYNTSKLDFMHRAEKISRLTRQSNVGREHIMLMYFRPITSAAHGRIFMRTNKGYYGLAPRGVKAGDCIAVIPGGSMPMVLRPLGSDVEGTEFQLLGECYVHGIMKGEVMQNVEVPLEDIVLR